MRSIVNMSEEVRVTDTGNRHKNLVKIVRVVLETSSWTDRHTDRQTYSTVTQYFATAPAPAGELKIKKYDLHLG